MQITAPTLSQAREALIEASQQRLALLGQIREQGRKIADLEREVQKQAGLRSTAEQQLADARVEIEALRAQLPDDATLSAFDALQQFLTSPSEVHPELRLAA